jgi:signal transduction histidine kinase
MIRKARKNSHLKAFVCSLIQLENRIQQLRRRLLLFLGIIAVLPALVFFSLELSHNQERALMSARQIALLIMHRLERHEANLSDLTPYLRAQMAQHQILFLRLLGAGEEEVFRLGEPKHQVLALTAEAPLSPAIPPVRTVGIQVDAHPLLLKVSRVLAIHLCVAVVLTLVIYTVPIRALRRALGDVQMAQTQVIHSDKLAAIGEAYASLAHEVNSPLSILLTRMQLLTDSSREQQLPPDLIRDLEVIERHGARIADILQGLLTFARKTPLTFVPTELNRVIGEAIDLVKQPFAAEGICIETALDPELPTCLSSPIHLQQVFLSLLNNGRDAMPQGGQITVSTFQANSHLVAEVQDTGMGIVPENVDRIFEPFFTTKKMAKGTGLGLSVSYGIITEHGGDIEVESTLGQGSIFRLTLPQRE